MKPTKWHKILSVTMALAVVLASLSVTINKHFCGSNLVDVALFSKVETCCKSNQPTDNTLTFSKKPCCSIVSVLLEGADQYPTTGSFEALSGVAALPPPTVVYALDFDIDFQLPPSYSIYRPPPLVDDIQVRDQVFLI